MIPESPTLSLGVISLITRHSQRKGSNRKSHQTRGLVLRSPRSVRQCLLCRLSIVRRCFLAVPWASAWPIHRPCSTLRELPPPLPLLLILRCRMVPRPYGPGMPMMPGMVPPTGMPPLGPMNMGMPPMPGMPGMPPMPPMHHLPPAGMPPHPLGAMHPGLSGGPSPLAPGTHRIQCTQFGYF